MSAGNVCVVVWLTYEAERRMLGIAEDGEPDSQGPEARKKRRGLLRFGVADGRPTGMPVLGMLYPSFVLAAEADPRIWAPSDPAAPIPAMAVLLEKARGVCERLLQDITKTAPSDGEVDERWYWAAPLLLDLARDPTSAKAWLDQANLATQWRGEGDTAGDEPAEEGEAEADADDAWAAHVREARTVAANPGDLGRPPVDLAEVLALSAVAGPAVAALRALGRVAGGLQRVKDKSLRNQAGRVAEGFRSLFNQPEVGVMLRLVNNEEPYWRRVLEYCVRGGLQAVLDEYAHVLVEHLGVSGRPVAEIENDVSQAMREALTLRTATVSADSVGLDEQAKTITISTNKKMSFRTRFAVRYGARAREDVGTIERQGDVQKAFNSPFWPSSSAQPRWGRKALISISTAMP